MQVNNGGPLLGIKSDGSLAPAHSSTSEYVATSWLQGYMAFGAAMLVFIVVQVAMYGTPQKLERQATAKHLEKYSNAPR